MVIIFISLRQLDLFQIIIVSIRVEDKVVLPSSMISGSIALKLRRNW